MLYTIKSEQLEIEISSHGAEIKRVRFNGTDRLHDSNPKYWNRSAPLLFPCIGTIVNKKTIINNKPYGLSKHGFIRDVEFELVTAENDLIIMKFTSNEFSHTIYPFDFEFIVTYKISGNTLESSVKIINNSSEMMPFNFGLHPAFKVPIEENENFEDYELVIHTSEKLPVYKVELSNGTINLNDVVRTIDFSKPLTLNHKDYMNDALVFNNIHFDNVTLQDKIGKHGVSFKFHNFPMLGIWTPYPTEAPFICIEPWIGCADLTNHDGEFVHKEHLIKLKPKEISIIKYEWTFF